MSELGYSLPPRKQLHLPKPHECSGTGREKGHLFPVFGVGEWYRREGPLGPCGHTLSGMLGGQETTFSWKAGRASTPSPGLGLQRHKPGDNWGLPGALEWGGAGISDSSEVSSWREQEERVRTFIQTQFLGRGRSWGQGRPCRPPWKGARCKRLPKSWGGGNIQGRLRKVLVKWEARLAW